MEYIQCTNCDKKYGVNDNIRAAVGKSIKCKACNSVFPIVIHDTEAKPVPPKEDAPQAAPAAAGGWDPSEVMPPKESVKEAVKKQADPEEDEADDASDLALLHAAVQKKKKQQLYTGIGLGVCLLLGVAVLSMLDEEGEVVVAPVAKQVQTMQQKKVVTKLNDHDNQACKQAAAEQWLIDFRVMNSDYSAQEYVQMLEQSQNQSAKVREACADESVVAEILESATAKQQPSWFEAEIHALQGDVYAEPVSESEAPTGL